MTRSSRHREKSSNEKDISGSGAYDGSAARTRPFSLEDIMIRRKNKIVKAEAKNGSGDSSNLLRNDNGETFTNHTEHDGDDRYGKVSAFVNAKKATEDAVKRSSRKEEGPSLRGRSLVKAGDKERHESDTSLNVKLDTETGRVKEHKNERESHYRSRTEEHSRDDKEIDKGKEHKSEKKSPHRSRNEERMRDDKETIRSKGHKDELDTETGRVKERKNLRESHHISRREEHLRGDKEIGKAKEHRSEDKSPHRSRSEERMRDDKETVRYKEQKDETGRVKERKNEKESHHRSRREEYSRADKEIGKAKEHRNVDKSPHRSRNEERMRDDKEIVRSKEHKDEKQHHYRSRNEKRLRDDIEKRMEHSEKLVGKGKFLDNEWVKSETESTRVLRSREEGRDRPDPDAGAVKKHSSGKYDLDSTEKKDRHKDASKSYDEGSERKRRRSRSPEFKARDRSISLSPRGHKRSYDGQEHGESSLHSSKDRKQHSDLDRNRVMSNGGHTSNHSWRHGGRGSGLGGYSPRKRRSEAAIRTPSPTARSPEKKSARWDRTPRGTAATPDAAQSSRHSVPVEHNLSNSATARLSDLETLSGALLNTKAKDATVEPDQITQATQPSRRLCVENLPASASDKSVMDCFNNFLVSSGSNHIQQNQPCINCSINKEKGQAFVEFLTAEDARKALSFDGRTFSNSVLKISRPKDMFEAANEVAQKSVPTVDVISEIVKDSPHKIFVGGISMSLSSDMLMEIVSAFGRLKAYHFEVKDDLEEGCAFLEYDDESITLKACAGLNGMKLGGKVLTAGQVVPDASTEENTGKSPFYEIPEHAKPLLLEPTKVLRLKNVFKREHLASLSEAEIEETLEDIRLECARFGAVKSINVVRCESNSGIPDQTDEKVLPHLEDESFPKVDVETREQDAAHDSGEKNTPEAAINGEESLENGGSFKDVTIGDDKPTEHILENGSGITTDANANFQEAPPQVKNDTERVQEDTSENIGKLASDDKITNDTECVEDKNTCKNIDTVEGVEEEEANHELQEASLELNNTAGGPEANEKDEGKQEVKHDDVFEKGSVFVEYVRSEASCIAAHSLHGRLYGEQCVLVNYIPHDLYISRFRK